ncbi:MAG: hypothetical protein JNJ45_10610 [Chthonomonas sp.]|nr:hypothetical protein [Chthonomonas sp.]
MIVESYEDVIILSGALRQNHWETIHTAVSLTLDRYPTGVIIDCSGLTECTLQGAETFRSAHEFIQDHDSRVIVAAIPKHVMDVLKEVSEVRSQLSIACSVEEARASLNVLQEHVDIEEMENVKVKKDRSVAPGGTIAVVLTMTSVDDYLVDYTANLCDTLDAGIRLIAPIIVPRELPMQSPLPEEERMAGEAVMRAYQRVKEKQFVVSKDLARGRDMGSAIEDSLEGESVLQVILGLSCSGDDVDANCKLVKAVLGKVSVPVSFVRGR